MSLKATKSGAVYTSDVISQGVGETDWVNMQTTLKCQPKEMTVLSGSTSTSLKTVDLVTTGEELVVYDGSSVKSGEVGTVSSVVGDNLPLGETLFVASTIDYPVPVTLNNGNIFIAFQDQDVSYYGTFVIYNPVTNSVVKTKTVFSTGATYYISATKLLNGNVFIVYRDTGNGDVGSFVIYDQDGNLVKARTVFCGLNTYYPNVTTLQNGNVFITYANASTTRGCFVIYSETGTSVVSETNFHLGEINRNKCITLSNGNVFIVCGATGASYAQVYSQTGAQVIGSTLFYNSYSVTSVSIQQMSNSNIFIAFRDGNTYGSFVIMSPTCSVVKTQTVFNNSNTNYVNVNLTDNGLVFLAFADGNANLGRYMLYDNTGAISKTVQSFNSGIYTENNSTKLLNGNILLAGRDGGTSNQGTYQIFNTGTYYTSDITSLALSGTPTKAWKSSDLPETYTSFEGTGRTLLADKSVTIDSSTASQVVFKDNLSGLLKTGDDLGVEVVTTQGDNLPGTETVFNASASSYTCSAVSSNGNFILVYSNYFKLYNSSKTLLNTIQYRTSPSGYSSCCALSNGNFVIIGSTTFTIVSSTGTVIKTETSLSSSSGSTSTVKPLSNGGFVVYYKDLQPGTRVCTYNSSGTLIYGPVNITTDSSGETDNLFVTELSNGNILCGFRAGTSPNMPIIKILNSSLSPQTGNIELYNATVSGLSFALMNNGNIMVSFNEASIGKYLICTSSGVIVKAVSTFLSQAITNINSLVLPNNSVLLAYKNTTTSNGGYHIISEDGVVGTSNIFHVGSVSYFIGLNLLLGDTLVSYVRDSDGYGTFNIINTAYETTDYVVEATNVSEVATVGTNLPLGEVTTFTNSVDVTTSCKLNNGNIIAVYRTSSNSKFIIYNQAGTVIKSETVLYAGSINADIDVSNNSGNIFITYTDSSTGYGMLTVLDIDGNSVAQTTITSLNVNSCKALPDGNVLIFGRDANGYISVAKYSSTGNSMVGFAVITTASAGNLVYIAQSILLDDRVFLFYIITGSYYYCSVDLSGNILKSHSLLTSKSAAGVYAIEVVKTVDNNIIAFYNDWGVSKSYFKKLDKTGNIIGTESLFANYMFYSSNYNYAIINTSNNYLFFIYRQYGSSNSYYTIFDYNMNIILASTLFTTSGQNYFTPVLLDNRNVLISYIYGTNGKLNIINTAQYSTYTCTIPAQVSAPISAKIPSRATLNVPYSYSYLSSNLNIVYNQIENSARDLQFKHVAKNSNDVLTSTSFALNKAAS